MNCIGLSSIVIASSRQRREHDETKHQELIASLQQSHGLMHPPVLRREADKFLLVAGERRLKAISELHELGISFTCGGSVVTPGMVPYLDLGELDHLEAEEAELEENIRRVDLTWQEEDAAIARLVALRKVQAQVADNPPPTMAELALEVEGHSGAGARDKVSKAVVLARNLHRPEVAKAKTRGDAYKALARTEERERNVKVAETLGKECLSGKHTLIHGTCLDWMQDQPSESFDVICSDPPYGMGADEFGDSAGHAAGAHFYDDSTEAWLDLMQCAVPELYRLAKPEAHAYLFCDFDRFHSLAAMMQSAGWKTFRTPMIWFKPSAYRAPWPEQGPQRKYETILYAVKGGLKTTTLRGDVIECPPDANLGHPAQKPVALYRDLLARSIRPGMKVLDPFCGTGPVFPAAHSLSAIATGVEMDDAAYGIAAQRLAALKEG